MESPPPVESPPTATRLLQQRLDRLTVEQPVDALTRDAEHRCCSRDVATIAAERSAQCSQVVLSPIAQWPPVDRLARGGLPREFRRQVFMLQDRFVPVHREQRARRELERAY